MMTHPFASQQLEIPGQGFRLEALLSALNAHLDPQPVPDCQVERRVRWHEAWKGAWFAQRQGHLISQIYRQRCMVGDWHGRGSMQNRDDKFVVPILDYI